MCQEKINRTFNYLPGPHIRNNSNTERLYEFFLVKFNKSSKIQPLAGPRITNPNNLWYVSADQEPWPQLMRYCHGFMILSSNTVRYLPILFLFSFSFYLNYYEIFKINE